MRRQRIYPSDDDGDYERNSAHDADVDDDNDKSGKQQHKQTSSNHRKQHRQKDEITKTRDSASSKHKINQSLESMLPFGIPISHRILGA